MITVYGHRPALLLLKQLRMLQHDTVSTSGRVCTHALSHFHTSSNGGQLGGECCLAPAASPSLSLSLSHLSLFLPSPPLSLPSPQLLGAAVAVLGAGVLLLLIRRTRSQPALKGPVALNPKVKIPFKLIAKHEVSHDTRRFRFALQSERHVLGLPIGEYWK